MLRYLHYHWRDLWPYAHNITGVIVAVATFLAAIYHGPRGVFETWDWYLHRFRDYKVKDYLETCISEYAVTLQGAARWYLPRTIPQISVATKINPRWLPKSLERLRKRGDVVKTPDGWKFKG